MNDVCNQAWNSSVSCELNWVSCEKFGVAKQLNEKPMWVSSKNNLRDVLLAKM